MGLFSRKERKPPPQVNISLDHPGPYAPGLQVSGSVNVSTQVPRPIRSAAIACIGRATTHNIRRVQRAGHAGAGSNRKIIHYHDDASLFQIDQGVFENIEVVPEKPLASPFSFTIPWGTVDVLGGGPYTEGRTNPEAYTTRSHPLPPTFEHFHDENRYATIEYGLQLIIHFADDTSEPYASPVKPFILVPPPNYSSLEPGLINTERPCQKYSSSRLIGAEKSTMSSFKDKFSSSTPSVSVHLKATTASVLPTGGSFSIPTSVEIDNFSTDGISILSTELRIRDMRLIPITFYRALQVETWSSSVFDRGEHEEIDEEKIYLNASPSSLSVNKQVVDNGQKWIFPATFEARIPASVCPSLRTLNINRTYRLKMVLEAEVCGKVFDHEFEMSIAVDAPSGS